MPIAVVALILGMTGSVHADPATTPALVGHRGLLRDAPENTLGSFNACIDLGLGFELDVRRTKDGFLIILHDEKVDRTTDGKGKIAELTLSEVQKLDAGRWFDAAFAGHGIPTLEAVFALVRERKANVLIAMDLKIDDPRYEADIVSLATKHQVLPQLVFIGRTIDEPEVRKKLRAADRATNICALAQTAKDLQAAIADADSNWVYTRFIPTAVEAESVRKAGKKLFLSGPVVNRHEPENFLKAREIKADAILTDFPLECRRLWREGKLDLDRKK